MNDWAPWACSDMISGGIKYIAAICFPTLSGLDDYTDKYSSSKVEESQQQYKCVLCSIILIASTHLVGVEWRNRGRLLSDRDCFVCGRYRFCTWGLWLCNTVETLHLKVLWCRLCKQAKEKFQDNPPNSFKVISIVKVNDDAECNHEIIIHMLV